MRYTLKDFRTFKKKCLKYQQKLGLTDWEINFLHGALQEDRLGSVIYDLSGMASIISLNNKNLDVLQDTIEVAKHEVLHLLLAELVNMAEHGERATLIDQAEHKIIRRLEKII